MTKWILTNSGSFPSAMILRDALKESIAEKILVTKNPARVKNLFIRYGCSHDVFCEDTKFNTPDFIKLCSNKARFSTLLDSNGILTPIFYKVSDNAPENLPVLVRTTLSGSRGEGIIIVNSPEEYLKIPTYAHWTPFYKFSHEFRAHIVGGKLIKLFRKVLREGEVEEEFPIRTNKLYKFSRVDYHEQTALGRYTKLSELIEKVHSILGGEFYALDIGFSEKDGYVIIEGNSAPGLNEYTATEYAKHIIENYDK